MRNLLRFQWIEDDSVRARFAPSERRFIPTAEGAHRILESVLRDVESAEDTSWSGVQIIGFATTKTSVASYRSEGLLQPVTVVFFPRFEPVRYHLKPSSRVVDFSDGRVVVHNLGEIELYTHPIERAAKQYAGQKHLFPLPSFDDKMY